MMSTNFSAQNNHTEAQHRLVIDVAVKTSVAERVPDVGGQV